MDHQPSRRVQTIAFLDLETTGLIKSRGPIPRITEIALVALQRDEFLQFVRKIQQKTNGVQAQSENTQQNQQSTSDGNRDQQIFIVPRIMNKILQVINPETEIHPGAAKVSGLYNYKLNSMPTFSAFTPTLLGFLENLPKPICFVAHNGYNFDFPILKNELLQSNEIINQNEIFCIDSIGIFRNIDRRWLKGNQAENSTNIPETSSTLEKSMENTSPIIYRFRFTSINGTPGTEYETSPSRSSPNTTNGSGPSTTPKNESAEQRESENHVRRQLFPASSSSSPPSAAKQKILALQSNRVESYSLLAVHKRMFDGLEPYGHHSAEADCLSLFQICAQYGEDFLMEMDSTMKKFEEIRGVVDTN